MGNCQSSGGPFSSPCCRRRPRTRDASTCTSPRSEADSVRVFDPCEDALDGATVWGIPRETRGYPTYDSLDPLDLYGYE